MDTEVPCPDASARQTEIRPPIRVLYSFPFRIGAGQICQTAWQQVAGLDRAGIDLTVVCGSVARRLPERVGYQTTLARGKIRLPFRLLGRLGICRLHDWIVSRWLLGMRGRIDLVHGWPLASKLTISVAKMLGIPFVVERPNAHTGFAQEVVDSECRRLGLKLPRGHEHSLDSRTVRREESEYMECDALLCPSDFVMRTFLDRGYLPEKLLRHRYGYEETRFHADCRDVPRSGGLTMIFAGEGAPRKGLHFALQAWIESGAASTGRFIVCGGILSGYGELLEELLSHPSVQVAGHRKDLEVWMRKGDVFVLPSLEEGSALVTYEARASGCVLAVSNAAGAECRHMEDGLVHEAGRVEELTHRIRCLDQDRDLLARLRNQSLEGVGDLTRTAAGRVVADCYREVVGRHHARMNPYINGLSCRTHFVRPSDASSVKWLMSYLIETHKGRFRRTDRG